MGAKVYKQAKIKGSAYSIFNANFLVFRIAIHETIIIFALSNNNAMKFSKNYQPKNRRKPSGRAKVTYTTRIEQETKEYLKEHKVKGGRILDNYVKEKTK